MKQTIRLTESELKQYIKKLIIEAGPYSGKDDYVKAGPFHTDTYHNDKLHYKYLLRIIKDIDNYFAISNWDEYKIGGWGNREGGIGSDEYKIDHILQNTMDELCKYVERMPKETLNNRLSDEQENQDYKRSKGRFKEIIKEIIEEGIADAIKSGLWKAKNVYTQSNDVKRQNAKPYNPYTYNKKNFHQSSPDYGTKEFNKMYNADDGWVMGFIQRDIDNMQKFLNGEAETVAMSKSIPKDISMAEEYGLTKYAEYMKKLWQAVQQKMNN